MLPRVTRWSLLNEPNQPGWLTPQYERKRGRLVATAAVVYRALARAGIAGLQGERARARPGAARRDGADRAARPARWRGGRSRPSSSCASCSASRRAAARSKARGCRGFKRFAVSGFAHHPYQRGGSRPPAEPPEAAGEITISAPGRLRRVLDAAARARRIPRRLPVYYTEFGFQTNPPDRIFGVRAALQPAYLNQSDWMAYRDRRVRGGRPVQARRRRAAAELPVRAALRRRAARSRATRPTGCRSGSAGAARGCGSTGRCARPRTGRRRACGSRCGRRKAARSRPSGRSRCARGAGSSSSRVPRRPGVWRLVWGALVSREARVAPR